MAEDVTEQNKAIMRRMLEAFNTGDTKVVKELLHPQLKDRSVGLGLERAVRQLDAIKKVEIQITRDKEVFPDRKFKEEVLVAEGDQVILHWSMTGTNTGPVLGRPATGRKVHWTGTEFVRIKDGKIVEHDDDHAHVFDLLWQLGLLNSEVLGLSEFQL
jgi:predicted ester cyclase